VTPGVLILTGQTASGKSALAVELAERFDAEIVGADSRQVYRGMGVGTAAPSDADRARVPHHLVDFLDPRERYSAARFVADALAAIDGVNARGKRAIVAGGTGFYVRALAGDVTLSPAYDGALRERLAREARVHPADVLHDWLSALAPARAAAVEANDPYRIMRALEIALVDREAARRLPAVDSTTTIRSGGLPPGEMRRPDDDSAAHENLRTRGIAFRKLYVDIDPEVLQRRIVARVEAMLANGFIEEAQRIGGDVVAADAVGYREALAFLAGFSTCAELRAHLIRNTRRYAKRQATWFRTEPGLVRVPAGDALAFAAAEAGALPGWA
jgi:tRNA dimethylallyltransferase